MDSIHFIQQQILRSLLKMPQSTFTELNASHLTSDHLSYHLKVLADQKLVKKNEEGHYALTQEGQKKALEISKANQTFEPKPLIVAAIIAFDIDKVLLIKRGEDPFLGKYGLIAGRPTVKTSLEKYLSEKLLRVTNLKAKRVIQRLIVRETFILQEEIFLHQYLHVYEAIDVSGEIESRTSSDAQWIGINSLEKENLVPDIHYILEELQKSPRLRFTEKTFSM